MLVIDVDALQAVHLLDGIDEIGLRELLAQHGQQVVRVERTVDQRLARPHVLAFLHVDVHASRNGVFLHGPAVVTLNVDLALALGDLTVADNAFDLADHRGILRLARLEQLDHAREASRDVLRFRRFARDLREHVAGGNLIAVFHHKVGAGRHEIFFARAPGRIANHNRRLVFLIARRKRDHVLRQASDLVHLLFDR